MFSHTFFVGILWLNENLAKIEDDGRYTYYAALLYWVFILIGSLLLKPLKSRTVKYSIFGRIEKI